MRFAALPAFAFIVGFATSAFAQSDASGVPNPFTDQAGEPTGFSSPSQAASAAGVTPPDPNVQPLDAGNLLPSTNDKDSASGTASFYQATKTDDADNR